MFQTLRGLSDRDPLPSSLWQSPAADDEIPPTDERMSAHGYSTHGSGMLTCEQASSTALKDFNTDRTGQDGTGRDGTGRDGTGRDGTGRDGTGRDGTGRDGTGRDGTGRDGTGRDGTGRDGTGRDGTGHRTVRQTAMGPTKSVTNRASMQATRATD